MPTVTRQRIHGFIEAQSLRSRAAESRLGFLAASVADRNTTRKPQISLSRLARRAWRWCSVDSQSMARRSTTPRHSGACRCAPPAAAEFIISTIRWNFAGSGDFILRPKQSTPTSVLGVFCRIILVRAEFVEIVVGRDFFDGRLGFRGAAGPFDRLCSSCRRAAFRQPRNRHQSRKFQV